MTLGYGNYGIFLVMGDARFISSTVLRPRGRNVCCSGSSLVSGLKGRPVGLQGLDVNARFRGSKGSQYPLIKEYTLNYRGLNTVDGQNPALPIIRNIP